MCGICGIWNLDGEPVNPALLVRMRDSLAHRGPDGAGCAMFDVERPAAPILFESAAALHPPVTTGHLSFNLGLGHRRLSIIDLVSGDQPMSNEDGTLWIVFNGEIYNYRDLRPTLEDKGHIFRTHSDTEVILHCYEEYGDEFPQRLNGIFAFAIWDSRRQSLFLARDHFGVKPLYYYSGDNRFYFGSELKAILACPNVPREIDLDALNLCLTLRHTPSPWTLLKDIRKLPPGFSLCVARRGLREKRFWNDSVGIDQTTSEKNWILRLQEALERSVVRQMVSDVPIGLSLSSGVDSSTLLALMSRHSSGSVKAFTVGFVGREDRCEIEPARELAKQFGAEFFEQVITSDDYANFMARYIWHLEEPIGNESAAAYYFVAEMARRQGVKVLLNGQGADEPFAGYERYLWAAYAPLLHLGSLTPIQWAMPRLFGGTALGERYQRFLFASGGTDEADHFLRVYSILNDEIKKSLVKPDVLECMDLNLPHRYIQEQLARAPSGTSLERMTYVDVRTSLPDNLLLCEDKMAMAASIEARVPFLDLEYMAVAEQIPGKFKLRGLQDKYIHRKSCERWVGKPIVSRPKIGFDNAVDLWLRKQLGDQMRRTIHSPDSFASVYLDLGNVLSLMQEHVECKRDHQRILFLLLSLENWHQQFVKGRF